MSLNIYITNINVKNISNLGSLNIGKTINCRNQATDISKPAPPLPEQSQNSTDELGTTHRYSTSSSYSS